MIRMLPLPAPQPPSKRTPGRYDGLMKFAEKIAMVLGSKLHDYSVLDVGGGDAWLGEMLVCRSYVCLDPHVAGDDPWNATMQGRAEQLPFRTDSFDLVVSKQTLPHLFDPELACSEMCRVAKTMVIIRQEFPESPIGWLGHSKVQIDAPEDITRVLWHASFSPVKSSYDGTDFIVEKLVL